MGARTADEIIIEGQLQGGRDDMNTVLLGRLADWLDRAARSWTWPILTQRRSGLAVPQGSASLTIGAGSGGITARVSRILNQPWLYDTTRSVQQRLMVQQVNSSPDEALLLPGLTGLPDTAILEQVSDSQWKLTFNRPTDRAYLMALSVVELQTRLTSTATVPWYPEDETMVKFVTSEVLKRENGIDSPSYQAALSELTDMMATDKIRHGTNQSNGAFIQLDTGVYR